MGSSMLRQSQTILKSSGFSSVTQSCPTLWDPMDCSTPGFPVRHQLPELAQTHVHRVSDTIQSSHPVILSSCLQSFPASRSFPISHFFTSSGSVLLMIIQGWFPLGLTGLISLQSKGLFKSLLQHHSSKASVHQKSFLYSGFPVA